MPYCKLLNIVFLALLSVQLGCDTSTTSLAHADKNSFEEAVLLYEQGNDALLSSPKRIAESAKLFKSSAELGNANAAAMRYFSDTDSAKRFELAKKAYELGSPLGAYALGVAYLEGVGVEQDTAKANQLLFGISPQLESMAGKDHRFVEFLVAMNLMRGESGFKKNKTKGLQLFEQAAERGDAIASYYLAVFYWEGREGVEVDLKKGMTHYLDAANAKYAVAQHDLGVKYYFGNQYLVNKSIEVDQKKAMKFFNAAAANGFALSQFELGKIFITGNSCVEKDLSKALHFFELAAHNSFAPYPPAQRFVGAFHFFGEGVPVDIDKGLKYYKLAADNNDSDSQSHVAKCYARGLGFEEDLGLSLKYHWMAADNGDIESQYEVFKFLYVGAPGVVSEDRTKALNYLRMSADGGFSEAQYKLGMAYVINNSGVTKNIHLAKSWLLKAANNGHSKARDALSSIRNGNVEQWKMHEHTPNADLLRTINSYDTKRDRAILISDPYENRLHGYDK